MRTDDLIDALAADAGRGSEPAPPRRLAFVAGLGGLAALLLVLGWLQARPDLGQAILGPMFWVKAIYTGLLGLAGYLAVERLSRPGGSGRRGWIIGAVVFGACAVAGIYQAITSPDVQAALKLLHGYSWRSCSPRILVLGLPMLALGLWALRGMAPTRPGLAGFAMGLFSGGVVATVYGLHCPEHTFTFLALWYSLGVLALGLIGGWAGRWLLRW
ncbi:DUF1109 family protein [Caulobacter vibrioides]|uniref:anti-sigma-F factor NrsF n=1 Tax=Caulobacter vibrioides TaxID=155892 RepID=UPI000BB4C9CB|nr:anti-sigma-F factor NrsF [Caulobacter vibrioides]ATC26136.1 DUF1109 domain-containing protein [Caulobacter vibrioides]AZH14276.1 DUF1109 family protein [Caulobacter vibrioides]PLR11010.1 DUF1109 domain-containing protein [Caulobacter vibrioides]